MTVTALEEAPSCATDPQSGVAAVVERAIHGDRTAWEELVNLYSGLIWAVTRQFRLSDADAADVTQTTWLRLFEHVRQINDRSRVGPWLATTARRECLRTVAQRRRVVVTDDESDLECGDLPQPDVDSSLLAGERATVVRAALSQLPPRWRDIMALLTADPPVSYEEIAQTLLVPIGSIGPTRRRCLRRLQTLVEV